MSPIESIEGWLRLVEEPIELVRSKGKGAPCPPIVEVLETPEMIRSLTASCVTLEMKRRLDIELVWLEWCNLLARLGASETHFYIRSYFFPETPPELAIATAQQVQHALALLEQQTIPEFSVYSMPLRARLDVDYSASKFHCEVTLVDLSKELAWISSRNL